MNYLTPYEIKLKEDKKGIREPIFDQSFRVNRATIPAI